MKREDIEDVLMQKLRKQKHLFDTYRDNPRNMEFGTVIRLLSERMLTEMEKVGMLPKPQHENYPELHRCGEVYINKKSLEWEDK